MEKGLSDMPRKPPPIGPGSELSGELVKASKSALHRMEFLVCLILTIFFSPPQINTQGIEDLPP